MTLTASKTNKKKGRRIFIPIVIIGALLIVLASYLLVSHRYPSWNYSVQGFRDKTTHYYQKNKPFKYGDFEFTFSSSVKSIGTKQDCPAQSKTKADENTVMPNSSGLYRLFACPANQTYQQCWQKNYDTYLTSCNADNQNIDENELADVQMGVNNLNNTIRGLSKDWFKIEIDGKTLDNNSKVNYYLKDNIGPNENSSNAFNFKVSKAPVSQRIIITLPGKASQIIQIQ